MTNNSAMQKSQNLISTAPQRAVKMIYWTAPLVYINESVNRVFYCPSKIKV